MTTWKCSCKINGRSLRTKIKAKDRGDAEYFLYAAIARKYPGKNDVSGVEIEPCGDDALDFLRGFFGV